MQLGMIFATVALAIGVQAGPDWRLVGTNDAGVEFSVDRASIRQVANYRSARTRSNYRKSEIKDGIVERVVIEEFDCKDRSTRLRQVKTYSSSGALLSTFDWSVDEVEWRPVSGGTIAEGKIDVVCA